MYSFFLQGEIFLSVERNEINITIGGFECPINRLDAIRVCLNITQYSSFSIAYIENIFIKQILLQLMY